MIQRILKAAKAAGKKAAIFCAYLSIPLGSDKDMYELTAHVIIGTDGHDAQKRAQQGFDMISVITDVGALGQVMAQQLDVAKGKGEQSQQRSGY